MIIEDKINNLKDKLELLILKNEEYSKILKTSKQLDQLIVFYMRHDLGLYKKELHSA